MLLTYLEIQHERIELIVFNNNNGGFEGPFDLFCQHSASNYFNKATKLS